MNVVINLRLPLNLPSSNQTVNQLTDESMCIKSVIYQLPHQQFIIWTVTTINVLNLKKNIEFCRKEKMANDKPVHDTIMTKVLYASSLNFDTPLVPYTRMAETTLSLVIITCKLNEFAGDLACCCCVTPLVADRRPRNVHVRSRLIHYSFVLQVFPMCHIGQNV